MWKATYSGPDALPAATNATWLGCADNASILIQAVNLKIGVATTLLRSLQDAVFGQPWSATDGTHTFTISEADAPATPEEPAHSELGASITHRWWNCPGSVAAIRGEPNMETIHSRRGTAAHRVAELCLTTGQDAIEYVDREVEGVLIDERIADGVQFYLDDCRTAEALPEHTWNEVRFNLASLNPPAPMYGTADRVEYIPAARLLRVRDYKNGFKAVAAEDNPQLKYYALGAMLAHPHPVSTIEVVIVQPNKGGVKRHTYDAMELAEWSSDLIEHARATQAPDAPLVAGPWCRDSFCPIAGRCRAHADYALSAAHLEFADLATSAPPVPAATLADEDIAEVLPKLDALIKWAESVQTDALRRARAGVAFTGWKLVETQGNEAWLDKAGLPERLAAAAPADLALTKTHLTAPPVPLSPAKARGVLVDRIKAAAEMDGQKLTKAAAETFARKILATFVHRPTTGTDLVPVSDTRPAAPVAGSEFNPAEGV